MFIFRSINILKINLPHRPFQNNNNSLDDNTTQFIIIPIIISLLKLRKQKYN